MKPQIKYKCLYEITGCIEDVATFLVPIADLPKQEKEPMTDRFKLYQHIVLKLAEAGCKLSEQQKMVLCNLEAVTKPQPSQTQEQAKPINLVALESDHPADNKSMEWQNGMAAGWNGIIAALEKMPPLYYTKPSHKPWVGLTDEEIDAEVGQEEQAHGFIQGVTWAEAKLKEKNT